MTRPADLTEHERGHLKDLLAAYPNMTTLAEHVRTFAELLTSRRGADLDGGMTSHDVIVHSVAATTTRTGLSVHAELDTTTYYPTGVKIPDAQMNALRDTGTLRRHDWHPEWNYTLNPPQV